jgi:hypothetical protein
MAWFLLLLGSIRHKQVVGVTANLRRYEPVGEILFIAFASLLRWLGRRIRGSLATKYASIDVPEP